MTLTLPRLRPAPVEEPEAPKKPRMYPSLLDSFNAGRLIAPRPVRGTYFHPELKMACAWATIVLGMGGGGDDTRFMTAAKITGYGNNHVGALSFQQLHMEPPQKMSPVTTIRDAVISLNDRYSWTDEQFRAWLPKVDRAIQEHCE